MIDASPFADWTREAVNGDASARRYTRLTGPDGATAILMDASAENPESLQAFLAIATHLTTIGLAPPKILWSDQAAGILIIEDVGPTQFAQWLAARPQDATLLYSAAVDVIVRVQAASPPGGLIALVPTRAAGMIAPLFEWYVTDPDARTAAQITGLLQAALTEHAPRAETLALRDFHAENLIWRSDRDGTDRVGLLDFQDAVLAPPEYDLVSLLRDARRDVAPDLRVAMTARFAALTGRDPAKVLAASACLGVQRNLRILGIFARLARRDGKARYLDLIPRVWAHVTDDLAHPALSELRMLVLNAVPPADASHLQRLRPR